MKDEDFLTKTINEGNVNIQKFPASKVQQLAKKMESSKATAKHIQQVAGDLMAAQIQLMQHQCTQLPARNYPRRKQTSTVRRKPQTTSPQKFPHPGSPLIYRNQMCTPTNAPGVVTHCMLRDSNVLQENSNVKYVTNLDISLEYVIRKANSHQVPLKQENPKHSNFVQGPYIPTTMLTEVDLKHQTLKIHSAYR